MDFSFDYKNIVLIIIAACNLFLGCFVYFSGLKKKTKINVYYFFLSLAVVLWAWGMIMWRGMDDYNAKLLWCRWLYAFATLIPTSFVFFCYRFPDHEIKFSNLAKIILLIFNALAVYISLLPAGVVSDIFIRVFEEDLIVFGPLYALYNIYIPAIFLWGFYVLHRKYQVAGGLKRMQIKYVFWGTFISAALGMFSNLILPTFNIFTINWLGQALTLIMVGFIAYAIIRYRLMNIKLVLSRSLVYFVLVVVVAVVFTFFTMVAGGIYFTGLNQAQKVGVTIVVSLIIVLGLDPLKKLLALTTDKIFFKNKIDHNWVLKELTDIVAKEIELEKMVKKLETAIKKILRFESCSIYIKTNKFICYSSRKDDRIINNELLVKYFNKLDKATVVEELLYDLSVKESNPQKLNEILKVFEKIKSKTIVPVFKNNEITAMFVLGAKLSGEVFDSFDLNLFDVLAMQFASALEKAKLYRESQQFGEKLKKEVNRATKELRDANVHLRKLDKAKTEFISITSHQLRTPLSGIKGYLSMLLDGDFGKMRKEQRRVVADVFKNTERLVRLVNIFLNISRIESGRLKLEKTKFDANELINESVRDLNSETNTKNLKLEFKKPKSKTEVYADRDKLQDVILNLVDNAIKYTPQGSILVSLKKVDNKKIRLSVKDTGVGINPQEVHELFTKFTRGKKTPQINTSGSGLGLFIAKKIIDLHNGKIWVESAGEGKGSEFIFEIPLK